MAPAKSTSTDALVALESFVGAVGDQDFRFVKGEPVSPDNPAVAKWPHLFGPQVYRHDTITRIEQATAAPGEHRA